MDKALAVEILRKRRKRLLMAYVFHVAWLASTCAFAATDGVDLAITTSLWLTLVTVPPVLFFTAAVHRACRSVDPHANSVGLVTIILATLFLTPFESGLILPARNLLISGRILRSWDRGPPATRYRGHGPPHEPFGF